MYDVAPDGRFLMIQSSDREETDTQEAPDQLSVVIHWTEELKRRSANEN